MYGLLGTMLGVNRLHAEYVVGLSKVWYAAR